MIPAKAAGDSKKMPIGELKTLFKKEQDLVRQTGLLHSELTFEQAISLAKRKNGIVLRELSGQPGLLGVHTAKGHDFLTNVIRQNTSEFTSKEKAIATIQKYYEATIVAPAASHRVPLTKAAMVELRTSADLKSKTVQEPEQEHLHGAGVSPK
ncbi:MAG: hypothetical protein ACHP65_02400 [Legionellales bacterium]